MGDRNHKFVEGEFYHIYAHSTGDVKIFESSRDCQRFLTLLFAANSNKPIPRLDRTIDLSLAWDIRDGRIDLGEPLVDIICFCLMPTHFHLLLMEKGNSNISKYLHRVLTSQSKYFNLKYDRRGHLFESKFHSKHIDENNYLLRLSSYIHNNPKKIPQWKNKEENYPWSSYQDFVSENRWGKLIQKNIIDDQFKNKKEYAKFMKEHYSDPDLALT